MKERIFNLVKNPQIQGTLVVSIGILTASSFSYLLQFVLGRLLSLQDFGTFNAFMSLFYITGVPATVLSASLIKNVAELKAENRFDILTALLWKFLQFMLFFCLLIFALFYFGGDFLSVRLSINNPSVFAYFGLYMGSTMLGMPLSSYLQGLSRFKGFAFFNVLASFLRLALPVIAILLIGTDLRNVFIGMFVGVLTSIFIGLAVLKKNMAPFDKSLNLTPLYKKILLFGIPVLLVQFSQAALNNIDILMVKKYLDADLVGVYAGTVNVGKILLFGAGTLMVVMYPQISEAYAAGVDYHKRFNIFLILQIFVLTVGVAFYHVFAQPLVLIMFGQKFAESIAYVPMFSVFMAFFVLIQFLNMYFLAVGKTKISLLQIPWVLLQFMLLFRFHQNLFEVIKVNIFVSMLMVLSLCAYYILTLRSGYKEAQGI